MAYDKAEWHYDGDFPAGLPPENGGTHIGMFLAWAIHRGHVSEMLASTAPAELQAVRDRRMTGRTFLFDACDEKLPEEALSAEGNAFAAAYYERELYFGDYEQALCAGLPGFYHVADTWDNFEIVCRVIDQRFQRWQEQSRRPWWQFWKLRK
ncbi:hypothetical protein [Arenimonas sp.]|uniref:DUF7832 domain-containing protein n=1 Tax=Arenimonas sp. TaxID=1872635 RepID=UPI0035B06E44